MDWIGMELPSTAVSPCLLLYLTLTYRLIKLRNLNLIRTAFVGFLFIHIKATKLKLFCADLWGKQDGRLLETVLSVWRSYAASRKLRHTSQTWALVRHHVRRNVHRAFVRLLANRAIRIKKVRMGESS